MKIVYCHNEINESEKHKLSDVSNTTDNTDTKNNFKSSVDVLVLN